jgi:hypothetical protein
MVAHDCKLEEKVHKMATDIEVIKALLQNSISGVEKHIENAGKWRLTIFVLACGFITSIFAGVFSYGILHQRVSEAEQDLIRIEEKGITK